MITRYTLLILTILISFLPSHKGCFPTVTEVDFIAPTTPFGDTTTDETTTAEPTTTLTPTTSTTSTTTTTTTLPPCPALNGQILGIPGPTPGSFITDFSPINFELNTYPVGTTLSIQCYVTPLGILAASQGTTLQVKDDSGTTSFQDIDNGPAPGGESFTLTCLPSGSYEAVFISTTSNAAQSVIITVGGSGSIGCGSCSGAVPPICLTPSG